MKYLWNVKHQVPRSAPHYPKYVHSCDSSPNFHLHFCLSPLHDSPLTVFRLGIFHASECNDTRSISGMSVSTFLISTFVSRRLYDQSRRTSQELASGVMAAAVNGNENAGLDIRRIPDGGFFRLIEMVTKL